MKNIVLIIGAIVLAAIVIFALGKRTAPNNQVNQTTQPQAAKLEPAPEFTLEDFDDKTYKLADFRGKLVVVNFWASWCPPCVEEMSDFAKVKKEFGDKFEILAINRGEDPEQAKKFVQDLDVLGSYPLLLDPGDKMFKTYKSFGMPTTVFIGADGNILERKTGQISQEEFRIKVRQYLSG